MCLCVAVIDGEGYSMGTPRGQQVTAMETSSGGGIMRGGIYHPSAAPAITDPQVSNGRLAVPSMAVPVQPFSIKALASLLCVDIIPFPQTYYVQCIMAFLMCVYLKYTFYTFLLLANGLR